MVKVTSSVEPFRLTSVLLSERGCTFTSLALRLPTWAVLSAPPMALSFSGRCTTLTSSALSAPRPLEIWLRRKVTFTFTLPLAGWISSHSPVGRPSSPFLGAMMAKSYSRVFSSV